MTPEVQNQIIGQFWGIVPIIAIFLVVAALLGIGFKILEKKINNKHKEEKTENEKNKE